MEGTAQKPELGGLKMGGLPSEKPPLLGLKPVMLEPVAGVGGAVLPGAAVGGAAVGLAGGRFCKLLPNSNAPKE